MQKGPDWNFSKRVALVKNQINTKAGAWFYVPYGTVVGEGARGGGHWASVNWKHKTEEEA